MQFPKIFLSLALLFCIATIQATPEDSLRNVISNTEGADKLEALTNLMILKVGDKDAIEYAVMLEKEARIQNDENLIGYALITKVTIYGNENNIEKFFATADEAMVYLLKKKQFNRYFAVYNYTIKIHIGLGNYETAILKISSMLEETKKYNNLFGEIAVYESMGDAYFTEKHLQKALEAYHNVFSLLNIHYPEQRINRIEIGLKIVKNTYDSGDLPSTILFCDSVAQIVEEVDLIKSGKMVNFSTSYIKMLLNTYYALTYFSVGKENESTEALNKAFMYSEDNVEDNFRQYFYCLCSDYYLKKNDNKTAFEYIEKYEKLSLSGAIPEDNIMLMKSKILAAMGDFEGAHKVDRDYIELTDSLNQKKLSQRVSELQTIHQVEKLEFQAEQERLKTFNLRMFIVGLTIIVLLLACVIFIVIRNLRRIKRKNLVLYQRIQSHEALEQIGRASCRERV